MGTEKSLLSFVNKESIMVALTVFVLLSTVNFMYAQNNTPANNTAPPENAKFDWVDAIVVQVIPIVGSILGLGVTALVQWMRSKGIPVTDRQEAMFREIVTNRFAKLAKDSWKEMRDHPENLDSYWKEPSQGHIPKEFQDKLKDEGYDFAMSLKQNKEFRDFAKDITKDVTGKAMERLLKDLRTNLANEYQEYMIDVIPKIASTAVDSAFDPKVDNVETWAKTALENLKPLLLTTEAIDTEKNLMIIIRAEIDKRLQERLKKVG